MSATVSAGRFVGQRLPRTEDARLLTGAGTFTDDVDLPGTLHVAFVRSTVARGRIKAMDISAVRETPGVRAVYTAEEFARFGIEIANFYLMPMGGPKVKPLSDGYVSYVGDPVALVVADSRYIAEDAAGLAVLEYEEEEPLVTIADGVAGPAVHPGTESNLVAVADFPQDPELEKIFANAAHVVTGTVRHQRVSQAPMETRGILVSVRGNREMTIYTGCQSPTLVVRLLALTFDLPETNVRVISKDVGGSFGLKVQPWREEIAVVAAGLLLRRPLKWIEDRLEALTTSNSTREAECTVRMAFDADARLLAADIDYASNNGAYPHQPDANMAMMMFFSGPYKLPRLGFKGRGWHTNTVGLGGYRGPWAMEALARETVLDLAARQIGVDPVELRRRNLISAADQPTATLIGMPIEDITPIECLDELLKAIDVPAFRAEQKAAREEGRYLGLGIATYIEPTAASNFAPLASDVAHIRIEATGKVSAMLTTHSQGQGTQTTMAQVIADQLGVPFEDVAIYEDDSSRTGYGPGASGSRQAVAGGGASIKAAEILVRKLKTIAAHLLNAGPDDVEIADGMVRVAGAEPMTRTLREIAEIAYNEPDRLPPGMEPGLEAQYRYRPPPVTFSTAAHACVVELDADTGFVAIKRWVASEDCGVLINPAIVEGQIAGGLAQAIGMALLEELHFDGRGNPTAVTFKDYMLPTIFDVPDFEYTHLDTPSKAVGGFRGVGEGGAIIGTPTLVNAINDALAPFGVHSLDLPLTPARLVRLMEGGEL
jgi:carbon-monoxide dehydrogenase large subunit